MSIFKPPPAEARLTDGDQITLEWLTWFSDLHKEFNKLVQYDGSATWDPGSIADGGFEAKTVTVTGAALGDFALASFSLDVQDLYLGAEVTAGNTVTCILVNSTGGAVDLSEGTVYVRVIKR